MEHVSEVAKIVEHALAGNRDAVKSYGQLLVDKLRNDGEEKQAKIIERRLSEKPLDPSECVYLMAATD